MSDRQPGKRAGANAVGGTPEARAVAPGKVSRVQHLAARDHRPDPLAVGIPTAVAPAHDDPFGAHLIGAVQRRADGEGSEADVHAAAAHGTAGPAGPLPYLDTIQRSFGAHDVSHVQAHSDGAAAEGARAMGAEAFAVGDHVAFRDAPSLHTAAHEAAHVVQQRAGVHLTGGVGTTGDAYERHADQVADLVVKGESAEALLGEVSGGGGGPAVQRYEAGEHAKTGDTAALLKKAYAPIEYTVKKGEMPDAIATQFGISVAELKDANRDKLHKWPTQGGATLEGFNKGEKIAVPQKLNEMQKGAAKDPALKITFKDVKGVKDVVVDYGAVVAMGGDLFGSVEDLAKASPEDIEAIVALIEEEKTTGKAVSTVRWQTATKGRFLDLAAKNDAHFAPSNPDFVAVSGKSTGDHLHTWQDHHRKAITAARAGDKNKALMINAFGDHFLTDAFAAGHLFNKGDVMAKVESQLPTTGTGDEREFQKAPKEVFDAIAKAAFVGAVATEFKKYETVKTYYWIHADIDSADRFSMLLQGIHLQRPELLDSAVAKGIHDKLNTIPGGLAVENELGDKWQLSGDNTMNPETLAVAQRAVAQSQQNVMAAFRVTTPPNEAELFKKVWDHTPRPTAASKREVIGAIDTGANVTNPALQLAVVKLINAEYMTIITELLKPQPKTGQPILQRIK